jgi:hypothetical protein
MFGRYTDKQNKWDGFEAEDAKLEGFDVPLKTTPFQNQYNAPGGLKKGLDGYYAWQSHDMENWVHHGPVTERFSKWVTTAEYADGKAYVYYDYPNDQDPHLYIDDDLTDEEPGEIMGMAFKDPSHGSDCGVIRDLEGNFHLIYENWDPINARRHSWDSPLAGHAVSPNGIDSFKILPPAVDERTTPTGEVGEFRHPHWTNEHPDWDSDIAKYNIHEPEQNAYGDWAATIKAGSESAELICHTDFMPTVAEIIEINLPADAAVDGVSYKTAFSGKKLNRNRPEVVHHSIRGKFAIRSEKWKLVLCPGSGGWSDPNDNAAREQGLPDVQLYNMQADIEEQHNLQAQHPEIVKELTKTLEAFVDNGRSTPGPRQNNDIKNIDIWKK